MHKLIITLMITIFTSTKFSKHPGMYSTYMINFQGLPLGKISFKCYKKIKMGYERFPYETRLPLSNFFRYCRRRCVWTANLPLTRMDILLLTRTQLLEIIVLLLLWPSHVLLIGSQSRNSLHTLKILWNQQSLLLVLPG